MGERLNKILFATYFLSWIGLIISLIIGLIHFMIIYPNEISGSLLFFWNLFYVNILIIILPIIALIGASFNIKSYKFILIKLIPPVIFIILFSFFVGQYSAVGGDNLQMGHFILGFSFSVIGYFFFLLLITFFANKYSIMKYGEGEKFLKEGKLLFIIIIIFIITILLYSILLIFGDYLWYELLRNPRPKPPILLR